MKLIYNVINLVSWICLETVIGLYISKHSRQKDENEICYVLLLRPITGPLIKCFLYLIYRS